MISQSDKQTLRQMANWWRANKTTLLSRNEFRSPRVTNRKKPIKFVNLDTTEAIPPYACMQVVTNNAQTLGQVITIKKPSLDNNYPDYPIAGFQFIFNGGSEVKAGEVGEAVVELSHDALWYSQNWSNAAPRYCGPIDGEWFMGPQMYRGNQCDQSLGTVIATTHIVLENRNIETPQGAGSVVAVMRRLALDHIETKLIQAPSGGIPKRVGAIAGEASCVVVDVPATPCGNPQNQITGTGESVTVLNWATHAACTKGYRYGIATRHRPTGPYWIEAEDCMDDGSAGFITASGTQTFDVDVVGETVFAHRQAAITLIPRSGTGPFKFSVEQGTIPSDFTLDENLGTITGEPTRARYREFSIGIRDADGNLQVAPVQITTNIEPLRLVNPTGMTGLVIGAPYEGAVSATGGLKPYTFSVDSLPSGITLDSATGVVSGTPDTTESGNATFNVTDAQFAETDFTATNSPTSYIVAASP